MPRPKRVSRPPRRLIDSTAGRSSPPPAVSRAAGSRRPRPHATHRSRSGRSGAGALLRDVSGPCASAAAGSSFSGRPGLSASAGSSSRGGAGRQVGARSPGLWRGLRGSPRALGVPVSVPQAVPGRPHGDGASWLSSEHGAPSAGGSLQLQGFALNVVSAPSTLHSSTFPTMFQAPAQPPFSGWGALGVGADVTYLPAYPISGNAGPRDGAAPLGPLTPAGGAAFSPPLFSQDRDVGPSLAPGWGVGQPVPSFPGSTVATGRGYCSAPQVPVSGQVIFSSAGSSGLSGPRVVWSAGLPAMSVGDGSLGRGGNFVSGRGCIPAAAPSLPLPGPSRPFLSPVALPRPVVSPDARGPDMTAVSDLSEDGGGGECLAVGGGRQEEGRLRARTSRGSRRNAGVSPSGAGASSGMDAAVTSATGEHGDVSFSLSSSASSSASSSSSSSSSTSSSSSESSGSPRRPRKLAKLVARAVAKRVGSRKARRVEESADPPLYADMVRCANTAVARGLRKSVRRRIRKGKFVDVFSITEDMQKEVVKAKKAGAGAEEGLRDFHRWLRGFLVFSTCYLETRQGEQANVLKYVFLINELFLLHKSPVWREYDEKFRRNQCGNPILPMGFKDVEIWLEVVGRGPKVVEGQSKRSFPVSKFGSATPQKGKCFAFNESKCDRGAKCRFRHSCKLCGGSHPAKDCKSHGSSFSGARGESGGAVS